MILLVVLAALYVGALYVLAQSSSGRTKGDHAMHHVVRHVCVQFLTVFFYFTATGSFLVGGLGT